MTGRMRLWHLALLPLVLPADYLLAVVRHEGSHALVAMAFGAEVAEFHLWPPRGVNLSWITIGFRRVPHPAAVPLQAAAPYGVAVALIAASLWVAGRLPSGFVRANVLVAGVVFPCAELATNVLAFWLGPNDFYYALGTQGLVARVLVTAAAAVVGLAAARGATACLQRA
jgi:hypothetical protein